MLPTDISIILTYRCQMRCKMCNIWKYPSEKEKEITAKELNILPKGFAFINLIGGEPFLGDDLEEIIRVLSPKAKRIVIFTSGWHYKKILEIVPRFILILAYLHQQVYNMCICWRIYAKIAFKITC